MTLYTFPNPRPEVRAVLNAAKSTHWPTALINTAFPTTTTVPYIQHAFDGSPSQQANRQVCTVRITAWQPKEQPDAAVTLAQRVAAVLLDAGNSKVWRFRDPVGFNNGVDASTGLPFCTFTVTAETRPIAVA